MPKFESPQNIKYRRMVFRMINEADLVLEVLDARFPHLTRSTEIEEYARQKQKKILFIITTLSHSASGSYNCDEAVFTFI